MNIALCDLNHTTVGIHTETMPLAIGLLGSYIIKSFPGKVDVRLFKFEDDFINEIDNWKPDLMGLSLYSWNTSLIYIWLKLLKVSFLILLLLLVVQTYQSETQKLLNSLKAFHLWIC